MNRRTLLAGMVATAAGLLVPEAGLATPARRFWALDRTMVEPPRPSWVDWFLRDVEESERVAAFYAEREGRVLDRNVTVAWMEPGKIAALAAALPKSRAAGGAVYIDREGGYVVVHPDPPETPWLWSVFRSPAYHVDRRRELELRGVDWPTT